MASSGEGDEVVLACRDLRKDFRVRDRQVAVLDGVALSVRRGEVVAVTGRTGTGKSTLLGLLGGLDRPTSGEVLLEGKPTDELSAAEWSAVRRRKIGFLFQRHNLLPAWTALENVEAAMLHTDLPRPARRERATALLEGFDLGDRLDHLPAELSVGQQQLVAIARALANEPVLLLADEPTGDVDPATADAILARLTAAVRTRGTALLIATHGTFPLEEADRVFVLADGALAPAPAPS